MAKKKNGTVTLEKLARMMQRGFAESATKQDLKTFATKEDIALLRNDTETGLTMVTHTLKAIQEEIKDLNGMDAELTAVRLRLARVERKVGLARY